MSAYIERITHRSSTQPPTSGKISLTSVPHWPYFWNETGDLYAVPVRRSVGRLLYGSGWPWCFVSIGFGSKVSTWDGPPFMKRKMTRFAFGAKWGCLTASGFRDCGLGD